MFFLASANTLVLHNNNNNNFSTESGAHRTDAHNTLASSNNSEASVWMIARPCVGPDFLYRERTCLTAGGGSGPIHRNSSARSTGTTATTRPTALSCARSSWCSTPSSWSTGADGWELELLLGDVDLGERCTVGELVTSGEKYMLYY